MRKILLKMKTIPDSVISAIVYTFSTVFTRGLAIITVPIFTRIMSTNQIGQVNLFNSWYSLISVIATLSLTSGGFAVAMKEFEGERKEYVSSVLSLTSLIACILCVVYMMSPSFWNQITGLSTPIMCLMLIGFFVAPAQDFWLAHARYEYRYKLTGAISIASALFASIVSVIVVLTMKQAGNSNLVLGRLISNYIVIYGVAAIIWSYLIFSGRTLYKKKYWKLSLQLSLPLVGYSIAAQILNVSDRLMIDKMIGTSAVGIYSTLYTVSSLSLLVWNAINASFVPYMFQGIEKKDNSISKVSFFLLALYSALAVAFVLFAPEIVNILATKEYYEAIYIMPPIAGGVYLTAVSHMYSNIMIYYKKTKYIMYASIIAASVNVILNMIFIPIYGYKAAAYTTLISYIILGILEAIWGNHILKKYGKKKSLYADRKIFILSIVTIISCLLGTLVYRFYVLRYIIGIVFIGIGLKLGHSYLNSKKNS